MIWNTHSEVSKSIRKKEGTHGDVLGIVHKRASIATTSHHLDMTISMTIIIIKTVKRPIMIDICMHDKMVDDDDDDAINWKSVMVDLAKSIGKSHSNLDHSLPRSSPSLLDWGSPFEWWKDEANE